VLALVLVPVLVWALGVLDQYLSCVSWRDLIYRVWIL
jgi:hypothetical protein